MKPVSRRGGFSDRNGLRKENTIIQLKEFDERTRIQLWNMVMGLYMDAYGTDAYYSSDWIQAFIRFVLGEVYSETIDARKKYDVDTVFVIMKQTILHADYDEVLTLIEALVQYWDKNGYNHESEDYGSYGQNVSFYEVANSTFTQEYVGYRFVGGIIIPISDSFETETITGAIENQYAPVRDHILKASSLLADREKPDYENSIKESISAVEALSEVLTGMKGKDATLGNMLKKMEDKGIVIHVGLKSAFNVLYGYTSDAKGIRHAGDIGGQSSTFEEAKFMLVACCAFVNYLVALAAD